MSVESQRPLDTYISPQQLLQRPLRESTAIDPSNPLEIDDGIHVESIDGSPAEYRVSVHISDVGLLLGHTAVVDEARKIGWSMYDQTDHSKSLPMVPKVIYKKSLGLDARIPEGAPALEIGFDFDMKSREIGNVGLSKVRVSLEALTYRQHDKILRSKAVDPEKHGRARERLGVARRLYAPVDETNNIIGGRKSEDIVALFMIASNRIMAQEMEKQGIPWFFRNHNSKAYMSWRDERERRMLERIKPGTYGAIPIGHDGLGIDKYCHFTSPLRRFPDLANHLNLHAHMNSLEPPFQEKDIDEIAREMTALYIERNPKNFPGLKAA